MNSSSAVASIPDEMSFQMLQVVLAYGPFSVP